MFEQILRLIAEHETIIIHRHKNPDGDALGSQIGLKHILQENFPGKTVCVVGDAAGRYAFMDDSAMDAAADEAYAGALAIILDTSARALISDERYTRAARTVRIDHHIFGEKIADVEVVDTTYESCCGLITALAIEGKLKVTSTAAKSLYTGMVTDSGRFRYDSTIPNTFRLAAFLLEQGVCANDIYRKLYADELDHIRLRAQFALKIKLTAHNVAYIYTPLDEAKSYGVDTFTISRGMVGVMAEIRGVDIWANFTETEEGVLCELRSSLCSINPIAVKYGGGGHAKASGATLKSYAEAMQLLDDLDNMAGAGK